MPRLHSGWTLSTLQWVSVECDAKHGDAVVFAGEALQLLSNGAYTAAPHRVELRPPTVLQAASGLSPRPSRHVHSAEASIGAGESGEDTKTEDGACLTNEVSQTHSTSNGENAGGERGEQAARENIDRETGTWDPALDTLVAPASSREQLNRILTRMSTVLLLFPSATGVIDNHDLVPKFRQSIASGRFGSEAASEFASPPLTMARFIEQWASERTSVTFESRRL